MQSVRPKQQFIEMVNQNQGLIHGLCNIYYRREEDRQDTFQEIVLQLWKSRSTFAGRSKISTWIYKVSLNTILAKVRKEKKQIPFEPLEDRHDRPYPFFVDDNHQQFQTIINYLSDIDRAILLLYLDEHSYKEIAMILKLSLTNISSRIHRIKAKLRQIYKSKNYEFK